MPRRKKIITSRRQRRVILLSAVFLLAGLIFSDRAFFYKPSPSNIINDSNDRNKYHSGIFRIVNIVDGDTLDIAAPDGSSSKTRIRLLGIDTPETDKSPKGAMYFGKEASDFTKRVAQNKEAAVLIDTVSKSRDKYGRLLCYLLIDGRCLNELLLSEGFAYADSRFMHSDYKKYMAIESQAQQAKKGLWLSVPPEQLPYYKQ